ncbi:MAG: organic solvent tolerance protein OstA [Schwartzia sp.]|nr:organic solvent tolerance protein OstA [Schwartzia sp. (in: firmicutes)]
MDIRFAKFFKGFVLALLLLLPTATVFAEKPDISCDRQTFDFMTGRYLLDGNVRVAQKNRAVTADHAQVSLITQEVWAQGNVTLLQEGITFRGDDLYVEGRGHIAHLKENILFERGDLTIKADDVVFNWDTKIAECTGNIMRIRAGEKKHLSRLVYNVSTDEITEEEP